MTEVVVWFSLNHWALWGLAILVVVLFLRSAANKSRKPAVDPQRLFTVKQKAEAGLRSANSRCEHKSPFWFRCSAKGTHGDHIYPHSKGGATAMSNLQLLCPRHNLRKGAKVPSAMYIRRLEARRARYFPAGVSPKIEWRIGRAA